MEYLSLEILSASGQDGKFAVLDPDASVTITSTSELFAKGDLWSHQFTLNVHANAHIFGTSGEMHGARLHEQIHRRRARLYAGGLPLVTGYLKLDDEVEVDADGNVDVRLEGGYKTFEEMIDGAKANQVPMMDDVLIGLALWRKRWTSVSVRLKGTAKFKNDSELMDWSPVYYATDPHSGTMGTEIPFSSDGEEDFTSVQEYPRMVFPKLDDGTVEDLSGDGLSGIDCVNTDYAYDDAHPYCNIALCYQKQGYERKYKDAGASVDYSAEPEAQRGYEVMAADRVNSAPNFYVIYWIRALMKHLGIYIEENQMMDVEDLRRLFFVNTNCAYREPRKLRTVDATEEYGKYRFVKSGRHVARLVPEFFGIREKAGSVAGQDFYHYRRSQQINIEDSGFAVTKFTLDRPWPSGLPKIDHLSVKIAEVSDWEDKDVLNYENKNCYLHKAYATSECFPNADISEVIRGLEGGFGIRLLFSGDYTRVRIVLLRNIFRSSDVQDIVCEQVRPEEKVENAIRGFRMTYGDSEDTHFYYKGFGDLLPHKPEVWKDNTDKHDYSKFVIDAKYAEIIRKVSAFDNTCYVTPATGNAYGIKIDKDAKKYEELHPSLFEYAGFMDAEDGDCEGEEGTVETVTVGFKPAIMNDMNMEAERNDGVERQRFALFVDETMRPRRPDLGGEDSPYNSSDAEYPIYGTGGLYDEAEGAVASTMKADDGIVKPGEFAIASDMSAGMDGMQLKFALRLPVLGSVMAIATIDIDGHVNEGYRLYLQDNYSPTDSGTSPVETHDWGVTLGIMRGSGDDAYVNYKFDPDDLEGNDTWDVVPGSSVTAHPDTCDCYGKEFDYNGTQEGIGPEDRISLKLRAEKPNPHFDPTKPEGLGNRRYLTIDDDRLKGRGLCDQFYREYGYWVRNARIARVTASMELAQLLSIDKTKRVRVCGITGFVRKMQYTVSNSTGLGLVTMEIMYI